VGALESCEGVSVGFQVIFGGGGAICTFEVCHIRPNVGVQGVHNHFPVCRSSDLHSTVDEARSRRGSFPCSILADVLRLWKKIWEGSLVEFGLPEDSALKQLLTPDIERTMKQC